MNERKRRWVEERDNGWGVFQGAPPVGDHLKCFSMVSFHPTKEEAERAVMEYETWPVMVEALKTALSYINECDGPEENIRRGLRWFKGEVINALTVAGEMP